MDHGRPRDDQFSIADVAMRLGDEAPLSVDGDVGGVDRRRISVQWFSGTILTGLCGAALMGGAVFAALDGETNFATVPEHIETALRGSLAGISERVAAVTRKADRLPAAGETNTARNVIRISTTSKVGDREVVRVRPFVRVSSNLALSASEVSANIPQFNPQKIMLGDSDNPATPGEETAAAEPDAEVSFVTRDLGPMLPRLKIAATLPIDDVIARVRDIGGFIGGAPAPYATASVGAITSDTLAYAAEPGRSDPYAGFEARIVPENMTMLPKTSAQSGSSNNDKVIMLKKGDTIVSVLKDLGASLDDGKAIAATLGARGKDGALKEGQKVRVLIATIGGKVTPLRVTLIGDAGPEAIVALSDLGKYVQVDIQSAETSVASVDDQDEEDDGKGVRLYQSIYETALRNQIPRSVIDEMIRVYSYDVDFQRKAMPGDSLEVLYAGEDESAAGAGEPKNDIYFASLTVGGEVKRFYRYQTTDDSVVDYYDETGKSAKKFLVRKPIATGVMRSGFGARRHPILGYTKMHTGVDWAAPMGTPIYASGSGTIDKVGWESGYGKYIRIKHANGYETAYGHMTAYARSMEPGKRVRQGQLIGFVGSTGLSTGAHVHYEILVNGRFVDPMRIRLPRGRALDGPMLATFEKERDRLDGMMTRTPSRMAATTTSGGR